MKTALLFFLLVILFCETLVAQDMSEKELITFLDSLNSNTYIAWEYQLDELKVIGKINPKKEALFSFYNKTGLSSSDELIGRLGGVNMIRRGNYAYEPVIRGLSGGQINVTIDGMKMLGACTDKMDPVSSYVEPQNLESISINHGVAGSDAGNSVGGQLNMKLKKSKVGLDENMIGEVGARFQSVSNNKMVRLGISDTKKQYGWRLNGVYRNSQDYIAGGGAIVDNSGYEKINASVNSKIKINKTQLLDVDLLYDRAMDIGYPALPMDVSLAEAIVGGVTWSKFNLSDWSNSLDLKIYANHINHIMDDTKRENVQMHMDMPGWTTTLGGYAENIFKTSEKHTLKGRMDFYNTRAFAEMTMDPDGEFPMYMLTWPDIHRFASGATVSNEFMLSGSSSLFGKVRLEVSSTSMKSEMGKQQFSVFPYTMKDSYIQALPSVSASWKLQVSSTISTKFSAGYGSRLPTESEQFGFYLYNSYDGFDYIGYPNINPERSAQVDAGVKYSNSTFEMELSGFAYHFSDYIIGIYNPDLSTMTIGAVGVKEYRNVDAARLLGSEARIVILPWSFLDVIGSLKYTYGADFQDNPLPLIPPLKGNASLRFHGKGFSGSIEHEWATSQNRVSLITFEDKTDGFYTVNVRFSQSMEWKKLAFRLDAGIENLGDVYYWEHLDWGNIPRPGRNFYIGLSASF